VRSGRWKLYLALEKRRIRSGKAESATVTARLFDVVTDPGEKRNVATAQPDTVAALLKHARTAREEIGDLGHQGRGQRPAGWMADPQPLRLP
jgi:hypothetical protein